MKDKEKQIEEMAETIQSYSDIEQSYYDGEWHSVDVYSGLAKTLYSKDFRIINEDSVVLTETERIAMCVEQWDKGYAQGSKNTAEKILKDIMFCIDINDCNKNEMLILNLCKMLAKQYGVEIKE